MPRKDSTIRNLKVVPVLSFICRKCDSPFISQGDDDATCACSRRLTQRGLLFQLDNPSDVRGHRLNDEIFDRYLQNIQKLGWSRAFYDLLRSLEHDAVSYYSSALSPWLAGWKWLLGFSPKSRFLLIGAAQEAIALSLSSHGSEVVVVDRCRDRLLATALAADALGASVTCIEAEKLIDLPFPVESFDAVIIPDLQDTLRFFGSSEDRCLPTAQLQSLRQLLKPYGQIFVAGDNRFTYAGISGKNRDDDSEILGKRPRRSSTSGNSYRGYQQRLREAGFVPHFVYAPLPRHRKAREYIPLNADARSQRDSTGDISRQVKERLAVHPNFLKAFGHSFSIVAATSERGANSFLQEMLLRLEWQLKLPGISVEQLEFSSKETKVYCKSDLVSLLIRIPQSPANLLSTLSNADFLKRLRDGRCSKKLQKIVPQWQHSFEQEGVALTVETRPAGRALAEFLKELHREQYAEELLKLLLSLSAVRKGGTQPVFPLMVEMLDSVKGRIIDRAVRGQFEVVSQRIIDETRGIGLPGVLVHGAVGLDTIYWDADKMQVSGLIDWHNALERGLPGWDCIALETSYIQASFGCSFGEAILFLLEQGSPPALHQVTERYADSLRIKAGHRSVLVMSYWLLSVWRYLSYSTAPLNYPWLRRNVISVLAKQELL